MPPTITSHPRWEQIRQQRFLYGELQYFYPGAYAVGGTVKALNMGELIYFSFTALSTAGFGDISPMLIQSRFLTILEMVTG